MKLEPDPRAQPTDDKARGTTTSTAAGSGDLPDVEVPDHTLVRRIGRGSYGEVWLAHNALGTWRAVKIVRRSAFDADRPYEREFAGIQRFEPISRSHESQLNILQVGRVEDGFYYVMELADDMGRGREVDADTYTPHDLRSEIHLHGRLPVARCLRLGLALTTALEHLHRHGLVHRDIKPSNIVFVNGIPKLADIGLVAQAEATMSFVGTEGFVPPEGPGTPQADIFSLGKVLYELSTGHDRHQFPELPTRLESPAERELLGELNEVLLRACERNPAERYPTAAEMHADLALLESGRSVVKLRGIERRLRFVQRAGAAITAVAALAAGLYLWQARQTTIVRELAEEMTRLATDKEALANHLSLRNEQDRQRGVRLNIANGLRLLEATDPAGALLWFADALNRMTNNPAEESIHRIRIQQTLNVTPRVLRAFPHESGLTSSAFSPDGQWVATGTRDGNVRVWSATDGSLLWGPKSLGTPVAFLRFSRDGSRLFASSSPHQGMKNGALPPLHAIAMLDARSGQDLSAGPGWGAFTNVVWSSFSPDDRWLAVSQRDHLIHVLDLEGRQEVRSLEGHTGEIRHLSFSANGSFLASASLDGTVRIWKLPAGEAVGLPLKHTWPVIQALLTSDGQHLVSATHKTPGQDDGMEIQVWEVSSGRRVAEPIQVRDEVGLFLTPGSPGRFFVQDRTQDPIRAYSVERGAQIPVEVGMGGILSWDFSADGRRLALGNGAYQAQVVDADSGRRLFGPFHHPGWGVTTVEFSPDESQLLTGCEDGNARLWSLRPMPVETAWRTLPAGISPEGTYDARLNLGRWAGGQPIPLRDGSVLVFDEQLEDLHRFTGKEPGTDIIAAYSAPNGRAWELIAYNADSFAGITLWVMQQDGVRQFDLPDPGIDPAGVFTPDSRYLILAGADRLIRYWRVSDGQLERTVAISNLGPGGVAAINAQSGVGLWSRWAPSGETTESWEFFDLNSGTGIGEAHVTAPTVFRGVFSPDGSRLALLDELGPVTVLESRTGRVRSSAIRHSSSLDSLQWDWAGRRLLTTGQNDEVLIWDAETGAQVLPPLKTAGIKTPGARWSPDGRFIVTGSSDHKIRVWDTATGEMVTPPLVQSYYVAFAFMTRSHRVIAAIYGDQLRAWDLVETALQKEILTDYAKLLAGRYLDANGVLLTLPPQELAALCQSLRERAPELFE